MRTVRTACWRLMDVVRVEISSRFVVWRRDEKFVVVVVFVEVFVGEREGEEEVVIVLMLGEVEVCGVEDDMVLPMNIWMARWV